MEGGTGDLEALLAEKQQAVHQQALALRKERKRLPKARTTNFNRIKRTIFGAN